MKNMLKRVIIIMAVVASFSSENLFAHSNQQYNSVLENAKNTFVKTSNTATVVQAADFEKAATSAVPCVVHIKTLTRFKEVSGKSQQPQNQMGDIFGNEELLRRYFGGNMPPMQQQDQRASGSGVIISKDGFIVTNNHVVDGASDVMVTLNDRKNYKARVVSMDANTDLAILKIDAKNLPVMPIGNSDGVHLGQWVLAIGYPLNLDVTVTEGIVSAKSRNIDINQQRAAPVEAFIQTDAAVNPGSSGGALVNTNGELIGINAAIASPTGSYAGYAYAIPSNLMKKVIGDMLKYGSVQRGYLGINMAPDNLDDSLKNELGINDDINAVWVIETDPAGAAAEAGIKKGDAITKINAVPVTTVAELSEQVATKKPNEKITITFMRDNKTQTVQAVLKNNAGSFASQKAAAIEALGAGFAPVSKEDADKMDIAGGVLVTDIGDGIIGNETNMKPGFVITKVGDIIVASVEELKEAISKQGNNFQLQGVYPDSKEIYYYGINDFKK